MPVYEYVCMACRNAVEVIHGINVPGPAVCTVCGGRMRKALSAPAVVFRGSGWAKKDARVAAASRSSSTDAPSDGSDKGAAPGGSDSGADKVATSADKEKGGREQETGQRAETRSPSSASREATDGSRSRDVKDRPDRSAAKKTLAPTDD